ncbi:hypothetical protein BGZ70_005041 [Mortierella alpina]|uniref:Uncharacterized protein n=1 Tax=Mortierella alpina TaxID=64518 RepID=A0A9P6JCQ1_MORAP|nr:hypothetical protein BGZ70_005041 [Mortierella alpina]
MSDVKTALLVLFALMHIKSLPGVYTVRSLYYFVQPRSLLYYVKPGYRPQPRVGLLGTKRYHSRVWFDDLDLNIHLNNSSYNKMMDFARIDLCTSLFPSWQHLHKFDIMLAQTVLLFKAEVPRFSKYTITSRIFTWDDKWIWIQHRFSIKRKVKPVRKTPLEMVDDAAVQRGHAAADKISESLEDEEDDLIMEEEDEDDIDPIEARAPQGSSSINNDDNNNNSSSRNVGSSSTQASHVPSSSRGNVNGAASLDVPDKLCCIAYSRMVFKTPKGKTIKPAALFEKMGHKEAYPGEWEQYRELGMSLVESMMKIEGHSAEATPASRRLVAPTRAKI